MKKVLFLFILFTLIVLNFNQCKKPVELAAVITVGVKNIGTNSVTAYGTLTGLEITAKGFCWDTINNPSINNDHSDEGKGSESFQSNVVNLLANKKYYLRAYAKNDAGIVYGDVVNFQTPNVPTLETYVASNVTYSSASVAGFVNPNGHSYTASGICYDTLINPDISDKIVSAFGGGYFNLNLNNLKEKKVYYYRAFATFNFGTYYSPQKSFTTTAAPVPIVVFTNTGTVTDVDGNVYKTVKIGNQTWMAENLKVQAYNDGSSIPFINSGLNNWNLVSTGALGYYVNSSANNSWYGTIYNYYTIEDVRGLAPGGWHIPTAAEWQTLMSTLVNANSSYSLTAVQQLFSNSTWSGLSCTTNNYSNMNILPAGYRNVQGYDTDLYLSTGFWTTDKSGGYATIMFFDNNCFGMVTNKLKNSGYSIRCVKD